MIRCSRFCHYKKGRALHCLELCKSHERIVTKQYLKEERKADVSTGLKTTWKRVGNVSQSAKVTGVSHKGSIN